MGVRSADMPRPTVLIADDHVVVAQGLELYLSDSFELLGIANNGEVLVKMAKQLNPDVIVADISMPVLDGLEALRTLRSEGVETKFVVLTMHTEPEYAEEAFAAGAAAYVIKSSAGEELLLAINEALRGRTYITPRIAGSLLTTLMATKEKRLPETPVLTERKRQVLLLIASGKTMKEVAVSLGISPRTAESYKYKIMQQLGVQTTAGLIQHAIRLGLCPVLIWCNLLFISQLFSFHNCALASI
jgi:DNA-binding NarL/FixJ family response regulator